MYIPPGLGLYWRTHRDVQIGLSEPSTHVLTGLYPGEVPLLSLLTRPCTDADVVAWAKRNRVDESRARKIAASISPIATSEMNRGHCGRSEFAAAARVGAAYPAERADMHVTIVGSGLVGIFLAQFLDLEGIGRITIDDSAPVTAAESEWLSASDVGLPLDQVLRSRLRPRSSTPSTPVVVSVSSRTFPRPVVAHTRAGALPYLPVVVNETSIDIGPFVTEGTPCVDCLELHRTAADLAWPILTEQARHLPRLEPPVTGAAMAGAWVTSEILHLATAGYSRLAGAIISIPPAPGWPRITDVQPHPECGCSAGVNNAQNSRTEHV